MTGCGIGGGSPRRAGAAVAEVARIVRLYRERYAGFNAAHFHEIAQREHQVPYAYTFVKRLLQAAQLLPKRRPRGRHRRRREPRPCFGEMLHLDGRPPAWLARRPTERQTLLQSIDDAPKRVLYAQLVPAESTATVMRALWHILETHGLPQALYTDRAGWASTPRKQPVARDQRTQVGRALARLGIEHTPTYSPQARGRSERLNRTFQDRLVNELRVAGQTPVVNPGPLFVEFRPLQGDYRCHRWGRPTPAWHCRACRPLMRQPSLIGQTAVSHTPN